jgi:myosin-7
VLENFIASGPPIYQQFVMERLERTIKMGNRKRPPTSLEIASAFTKNPIEMPVFFYTGTISHFGDSQTSAGEIISTVYGDSRVNRDPGCSIFLCSRTMEQMTPLGSGRTSLMDAVFEYEALLENKGMDWLEIKDDVPWCIVFRKELFSPWIERPVNLELYYTQIMDGMERGTYICDDPERVALILAQRYYIQHGHIFDRNKLLRQVQLNPLAGMESISDQEWIDAVENVFKLTEFSRKTVSIEEMKIETVSFARSRWPLEFSRKFMNCSVDANGQLYKSVTVLVNADGVYVMQASKAANRAGSYDREIFKIPFVQFANISVVSPATNGKQSNCTITSVFDGFSSYTVYSDDAVLFHETVEYMYKGSCFRSKYVMASCAYKAPGDAATFLSFDQGDLIILPKIWAEADNGGWCTGICERTKKSGDFPSANVFVLPSVSRPDANVLALFSKYASQRRTTSGL